MSRTKAPSDSVCRWTADEDGNYWTECGEGFVFIDGGPGDNKMRFCCYCGSPLKATPQDDTLDVVVIKDGVATLHENVPRHFPDPGCPELGALSRPPERET